MNVIAIIKIQNENPIKVELYPNKAPETVANFINLARKGFYKNLVFHRIIDGFMIQSGGYYIENNTLIEADKVPSIKGEFNSNGFNNDLKHEFGVISMARTSDPNSASGQFFLCSGNAPWLDGQYAAFGKIIDGDSSLVIKKISGLPNGSLGSGFDNFPYEPVTIEDIIIEEQ